MAIIRRECGILYNFFKKWGLRFIFELEMYIGCE